MNLLLIDDDRKLLELLKKQLGEIASSIYTAANCQEAKYLILTHTFDVVICDHYLSNKENEQGKDLIREIRKLKKNLPIIVLTGRSEMEITPWEILDNGGDDFIRKPYRKEELIARIKTVYRRSFDCQYNSSEIIEQKEIKLNTGTRKLYINDREEPVHRNVFSLLVIFLKNSNTLLTYENVIESLWGENSLFSEKSINSLRVSIHSLKNVLKKTSYRIRNVYGYGYVFEERNRLKASKR